MKVLDEKGKLFGVINIIDLAVLLAILVLVAGGIWFMSRNDASDTGAATEVYYVTIRCAGFEEEVADYIHVGDKLYYGKDFTDDEIAEVSIEPAKVDVVRDDGTLIVTTHPELKDIYVTVKVNDSTDDPMIWIGQLHATVGKEIVLKTKYVEIPGVITKVTE